MLRTTLASSRTLRVCILGLVTFTTVIITTTAGNSGPPLPATTPDGIRHPASLTKIMTLYLLFERLDAGKMKLDTEMPVAEHASEHDTTKVGLPRGQTVP